MRSLDRLTHGPGAGRRSSIACFSAPRAAALALLCGLVMLLGWSCISGARAPGPGIPLNQPRP